jgi:hypothetical protein
MSVLMLCSALAWGCSGADQHGPSGNGGEGGSAGDDGQGGSAGSAGKGGGGGAGGSAGSGGSKASGGSGGGAAGAGGSAGDAPGGAGGGGGGGGGGAQPDGGVAPGPDGGGGDPIAGAPPYGCTNCTRLFDGKTLNGWVTVPGAWVIKEGGVLASTGKAADIYTAEDLGDYRLFFQIRHLPAMGGQDHQPCTTLFGKRPADPTKPARGLGGAQFQPPNGYHWDYGVGGDFVNPPNRPKLNAREWNQCEVVVKEAGSFKAACCAVGPTPCKTGEVLSWKGPGRKHPFDLMMHNGGLFDEYREIWIEKNQTDDSYLSQK